jgi:hypothetical protein
LACDLGALGKIISGSIADRASVMFEARKVDRPVACGDFETRSGRRPHALRARRDAVGHVIDVQPSLAQSQAPFTCFRIRIGCLATASSDAISLYGADRYR